MTKHFERDKERMKPLLEFNIYPENKTLYYRVYVWKLVKDFVSKFPEHRRARGLCRCYRVLRVYPAKDNRADRMKPILGEVHLITGYLTARVISHELTHALINWMAETQILPDFTPASLSSRVGVTHRYNSPEEQVCRAMDEMMTQVCRKLSKHKLI